MFSYEKIPTIPLQEAAHCSMRPFQWSTSSLRSAWPSCSPTIRPRLATTCESLPRSWSFNSWPTGCVPFVTGRICEKLATIPILRNYCGTNIQWMAAMMTHLQKARRRQRMSQATKRVWFGAGVTPVECGSRHERITVKFAPNVSSNETTIASLRAPALASTINAISSF